MKFLIVFIGGGFGSGLRYLISKYLNNLEQTLPYGTFAVNILGSFLIGFLLGFSLKGNDLSSNLNLLLITGFCGGFTTFSAFSLENTLFLKNGDYLQFFGYTFGTLILGIFVVFLGLFISSKF